MENVLLQKTNHRVMPCKSDGCVHYSTDGTHCPTCKTKLAGGAFKVRADGRMTIPTLGDKKIDATLANVQVSVAAKVATVRVEAGSKVVELTITPNADGELSFKIIDVTPEAIESKEDKPADESKAKRRGKAKRS